MGLLSAPPTFFFPCWIKTSDNWETPLSSRSVSAFDEHESYVGLVFFDDVLRKSSSELESEITRVRFCLDREPDEDVVACLEDSETLHDDFFSSFSDTLFREASRSEILNILLILFTCNTFTIEES